MLRKTPKEMLLESSVMREFFIQNKEEKMYPHIQNDVSESNDEQMFRNMVPRGNVGYFGLELPNPPSSL